MAAGASDDAAQLFADADSIVEASWWLAPWGWNRLHKVLGVRATTIGSHLGEREQHHAAVERIRKVIENDRDALMQQAATQIVAFLGRFQIQSNSGDQFKIAYWFGVALADSVGPADDRLKKSVLLGTIEMLDRFCETHCGQRLPEAMRHEMDVSIAEGKHVEDFGAFGLYFAFKSLAKSHAK